MGRLEYSEIEESDFVPLVSLALEDTEEVLGIKSLFQREGEYVMFLGPIEMFIAYYYCDEPKLKDLDVARALRKVKGNLDKGLGFFDEGFERELVGVVMVTLKDTSRKISKHELVLVLRYILWAIDNRKWVGDSRAYLNWICNFFGLFDEDEEARFRDSYEEIGEVLGIDKDKISAMLLEGEKELSEEEIEKSRRDSEEFDGEDEDRFWDEGCFVESIGDEDLSEEKMRSFHMGHDEEMDYECVKCGGKIGLHCRDWHEGMCDECFGSS